MTRVSISVAPRDNRATSEYFAGRCQGKIVLFSLVLSLLLITNVTYDDLKRGLNGEMDLLDFLRTARDDVKYLDAFKEVHVVLGNPSCDLDSTVSSIIHSCYLSKISNEESRTIIPVLNIPREDYPLRTEVTSFLSSQEINESYLIFRDDIDLRTLAAGGRLKLTLVDHNVLATEDADQLDPCVVQIIDHHDNGRKDEEGDRDIDIQLEPVGSCTSLIVENILNKSEELLDERTASLALGTILLDTVNLSTEANRTTEKDKEMVDKLSRLCPNLVHQEVFDKLQQSKFDVTGLSAMDILRKDLKSVSDSDTTIGLSSIPCSIEVLLSKSDENEEERGQFLQEFCKSRSLSALLLVAAFHREDGNLTRELGVFSPFDEEDQLRTKLTSYLSSDAAGLLLEEQGQHFKALSSFRQGNVKASRKVILPCVQRFLEERGMDAEDEEKGNNREADGASVSAAENEGSETKVVDTADLLGSFDPVISPETNFGVAPVLHDNTNNSNIFIGDDASSITLQHDMHINSITYAQNTQHAFDLLDLDPISTTAFSEQPVPPKSSDLDHLLGFDPFATVSAETKMDDQRNILQAQGSFLLPDKQTNNNENSPLLVDFSTVHEQTTSDKTEDVWSSPMNEKQSAHEDDGNTIDGNAGDRKVTFEKNKDAKSEETVIWINSEESDNPAESVDLFSIEEFDLLSKSVEEVSVSTEDVIQKEPGDEEWNRVLLERKSGKFSATLTPNNSFGDLDECERISTPQLDEDELSEKVEELHRSRSESLVNEEFDNENNQTGVDGSQVVARLDSSSDRLGSSVTADGGVDEEMQHLSLSPSVVGGHVSYKGMEGDISDKLTSDTIKEDNKVENNSAQRQFAANLLLNEKQNSVSIVAEEKRQAVDNEEDKEVITFSVASEDQEITVVTHTLDSENEQSLGRDQNYEDIVDEETMNDLSDKPNQGDDVMTLSLDSEDEQSVGKEENNVDTADGEKGKLLSSEPEDEVITSSVTSEYEEDGVVTYPMDSEDEQSVGKEEKDVDIVDEEMRNTPDNGADQDDKGTASSVYSEDEKSFVTETIDVDIVDEERSILHNEKDQEDQVVMSVAPEDQEDELATSPVDSEDEQSFGKEENNVDIFDGDKGRSEDQEEKVKASSVTSEYQEDGVVSSPMDSEDEQSLGKEEKDVDIVDEETRNTLDNKTNEEDEVTTSSMYSEDEHSFGKEAMDMDIVDEKLNVPDKKPDQEDEVTRSSLSSEDQDDGLVTSPLGSEVEEKSNVPDNEINQKGEVITFSVVTEEQEHGVISSPEDPVDELDNKSDEEKVKALSVESKHEQSVVEKESDVYTVDDEKWKTLKSEQADELVISAVESEDEESYEQSFKREEKDENILDEEKMSKLDSKPDQGEEVKALSVDSEDEQSFGKEESNVDILDGVKGTSKDQEDKVKAFSVTSEYQEDGVVTSPMDSEDEQSLEKEEKDVDIVDEEMRYTLDSKTNEEDEVTTSSVYSEDEHSFGKEAIDVDIVDEELDVPDKKPDQEDEVIRSSLSSEDQDDGLVTSPLGSEDEKDQENQVVMSVVAPEDQEDELATSPVDSEDEQSFEKEENNVDIFDGDKGRSEDQAEKVKASSVTSEYQEDGVVTSPMDSDDEQSLGKEEKDVDIVDEETRNTLDSKTNEEDEVTTSSVYSEGEHSFWKEAIDMVIGDEELNVPDKKPDQEDEVITSSLSSEDQDDGLLTSPLGSEDEKDQEDLVVMSVAPEDQEDELATSPVDSEDEQSFGKEENNVDIFDGDKGRSEDQEEKVKASSVTSEYREDGVVTSPVDSEDEQSLGKEEKDVDIVEEETRNTLGSKTNEEDEVTPSSVYSEDEHSFGKEAVDVDIVDEEFDVPDKKPDQEDEVIRSSLSSEDQDDGLVTSPLGSEDEENSNVPDNEINQKDEVITFSVVTEEQEHGVISSPKDPVDELDNKSDEEKVKALSVESKHEESVGEKESDVYTVDDEKWKTLKSEQADELVISAVESEDEESYEQSFKREEKDENILDEEKMSKIDSKPDQGEEVKASSVDSEDEHSFGEKHIDVDIVHEEEGEILNNEKAVVNEVIASFKSTDDLSTVMTPLLFEQSFGNEVNGQGIVDLEKEKALNHEPNEKSEMVVSPIDPFMGNIPHESDVQGEHKEGWFENDPWKPGDKDHSDSLPDKKQNDVTGTFQDNPFAVSIGVISDSDPSPRLEPISVDNQTRMVIGKGDSRGLDSDNTFLTSSVGKHEIENRPSSQEHAKPFHSSGNQSKHPKGTDVTENQAAALGKHSQYTDDIKAELKRKAVDDTNEKSTLSVETSSPINPILDEPNDKNEHLFEQPNVKPTDHRPNQMEQRGKPQTNPFLVDELVENHQHMEGVGGDSSKHMAEDGFPVGPLLEVEKELKVCSGQAGVGWQPLGNSETNPFTVKVSKEHPDESLDTKDKDGLSHQETIQEFEADSLVTISAQSLSFQIPCEVPVSQDEHLPEENAIKAETLQQVSMNPFAVDFDAFSDDPSLNLQSEQEDLVLNEHRTSGTGLTDALPKDSFLFSSDLQKDVSKGDFFVSERQNDDLDLAQSETNPFKSDSGLFDNPPQTEVKTEKNNDNIWEGLLSPEGTSPLEELLESPPLVLTDDKSQEFTAGELETEPQREELHDKICEFDGRDSEVPFDPIETFQRPITATVIDTPDQKVEEDIINVSVAEEEESFFSTVEMKNAGEEDSGSQSDEDDKTEASSGDRSDSEALSSKKHESEEGTPDLLPGSAEPAKEVPYDQDLDGEFENEHLSLDKGEDQEEVDHNEIDYNNSSQYLISDGSDGTLLELSATSIKEDVDTDEEKVKTEVEGRGYVLKESESSELDSARVEEGETMIPEEVDHNEMDYKEKYQFIVNDEESEEILEIMDADNKQQQMESQRHQFQLSAEFSEGIEDGEDREAVTDPVEEQEQVDTGMDEVSAINLEDVDIDMTTEKRRIDGDEDMATAVGESAEKDEQLDDDDGESTAKSSGSENVPSVERTDEVKEQLGVEMTPTETGNTVEDEMTDEANKTNLAMSMVAVKQKDTLEASHKKPVKISSNFTDLEAKQFELSLKPPGCIREDDVTSPNLSDFSESGVDMSPSHHSSSPKIRPSSLSLSDMSINSNKGVAVALPHTDTPVVFSPSLESLSSSYSHEGYLASPDQDDTPTPMSDVKSIGNIEDGELVYKRALSVDSELNRNVNRGWGDNQSLLDAILLTQKSNEEVINEMPQAEADIQAETNPQVSGERENERGEAEGAEEDDDADKISIKIARKNPPTISPDVQVLVDEADGGRGRLDTLLSDTSIGEFDYTIDDDDDEDEEETGREAKGAYSGAADSPNRKRLSAELALHLEDGTSITTEIIDAAYPAVLTPTSTEMSWDDDASVNKKQSKPESIPQYSAREEHEDRWRWRKVKIGDTEHTVDNKVIEPYKKVLSHGGYYGDTMNAIIVIASCYLPEKSRKDYEYVMHNLFLYVVSSLELLVAQDYMIVYFHGAAPRTKVPSLGWMKRCYQMIDRRLKKNLKGLYIIHPTGWLKTVITFTRPFISAKFYRKLKFIYRLKDLEKHVSMEYIYVPEEVKRFDETKREKAVRPPSGWIDGKPEEIPSISNGFPSPPYNARPRRRRRNPYPEADQSFMPQDADDLSDLGTEGPDSGRSSRRMSFSGSLGFFEDDFLAYAESHQPCSIEEYLMQQRELFEQLRQEAEEEYDLENVFP